MEQAGRDVAKGRHREEETKDAASLGIFHFTSSVDGLCVVDLGRHAIAPEWENGGATCGVKTATK